jgi:hypothetical protein
MLIFIMVFIIIMLIYFYGVLMHANIALGCGVGRAGGRP